MEPIIKTARISPSSFSLDLHQPNANQKFPIDQPEKKKTTPQQPSLAEQQSEPITSGVGYEPVLNKASIDRLIPRTAGTSTSQEPTELRGSGQEKEEREQVYAKAKQEGYLAGLESGKEERQNEFNASLKQIADLLHSLKDINESLFQEMENSAVEVVFEAVTKIIGRAAIDKNIAYNITREAIEQVKGRNKITVRVSPQDYELTKTALNQENADGFLTKNLSVVADNLVQMGGCLIETEAGNLDARLEIQLQRLKDTLLGVRKSNADA
jgi:flagellar biosynthesis/type III secretory pathway protein FliH